jgi:hypothetical protein
LDGAPCCPTKHRATRAYLSGCAGIAGPLLPNGEAVPSLVLQTLGVLSNAAIRAAARSRVCLKGAAWRAAAELFGALRRVVPSAR